MKNLNKMLSKTFAILFWVVVEALGKEWYETTTVYQIYPRSFKDSDGDGVGDLNGIREKLDYLYDLGIETLWLSPIFLSPMVDSGYDIKDYRRIDPTFGTMDDFKNLLKEVHAKGMKLILDFVPNHTSTESEWFKKSEKKEQPFTDFYIWKEAKGFDNNSQPIPPNNWVSIFGGPSWTWHEGRQQFYFKHFSKYQPDLNFWNPKVRAAMNDVLRFWLNMGVDGFRVDAVSELMEDIHLRDNPWVSPDKANSGLYWDQIHLYSHSQNETYDLLFEWRDVLDEYIEKTNSSKMMILETYEMPNRLKGYFSDPAHRTTNIPSYFGLLAYGSHGYNASVLNFFVNYFRDRIPPNGVSNYVLGNHDVTRLSSRMDPELAEEMVMMQLFLPGLICTYYGEELRMRNANLRPDQHFENKAAINSVYKRDQLRTPMQWDDTRNAGFSTIKKPWLPVNPDYWQNNVKQQLKDPHSHLNLYKRMAHLRKSSIFKTGHLETCVLSAWIYTMVRRLEDQPPFLMIMNIGSETENICLSSCKKTYLPDILEVHSSTANAGYKIGDEFIISDSDESRCSILRPKSAVLLTPTVNPSSSEGINSSRGSLQFIIIIILIVIISKESIMT